MERPVGIVEILIGLFVFWGRVRLPTGRVCVDLSNCIAIEAARGSFSLSLFEVALNSEVGAEIPRPLSSSSNAWREEILLALQIRYTRPRCVERISTVRQLIVDRGATRFARRFVLMVLRSDSRVNAQSRDVEARLREVDAEFVDYRPFPEMVCLE